jgi:hypothetical protein
LRAGEGGQEGEEVLLVAGPESVASCFELGEREIPAGLVEQDNFWGGRWRPPGRVPDGTVHRNGEVQFPVEDPVVVGALVEQELELEGGMAYRRRGR